MRQIKPTSSAQTPVLDPAHPSQRVGARVEGLHLQLNRNFSQTERLQLSEVARLSLEEEIALLRKTIKAFTEEAKIVQSGGDYPAEFAQVLDVVGLSCNRLVSLMRVQLLLQGPQSSGLAEDLISALGAFAEQMAKEEDND